MVGRWILAGVAAAMFMGSALVGAQGQRPLAPLPPDGLRVAPFFDGFYENADRTVTLSFGYSNLNRDDVIEIPLGPDNVITPKEYDGGQPTSFPPARPDPSGDNTRRRERERGVFTVTLAPGSRGDVVWTLRHRGQTFAVPGRAKSGAYRLQWPMAMGSVPPLLRFTPNGRAGRGPTGIHAEPMQASVGTPLLLTVWITDDSVREKDPVPVASRRKREPSAMNVGWYKHSGPGAVEFSPPREEIAQLDAKAATSATFHQPGDYVIRVRADNFGRLDTSPGNQCCWTNGYVKVTVRPGGNHEAAP